jgi:hypothetical protein
MNSFFCGTLLGAITLISTAYACPIGYTQCAPAASIVCDTTRYKCGSGWCSHGRQA